MYLKIHDYDRLGDIKSVSVHLATFGKTQYIRVDADDEMFLYTLGLRLSLTCVKDATKIRRVNSFIERNRNEIYDRLESRSEHKLRPEVKHKNFITTDKAQLGISRMVNKLIFSLGDDIINFYFDTVTEKYHIYIGNKGYIEAYISNEDLEMYANEFVTENQYRVVRGLLIFLVLKLRTQETYILTLENRGYRDVYINLRSGQTDLRWLVSSQDNVDRKRYSTMTDSEYEIIDTAVTGLIDMIYTTGVYGLIEEMNGL